MSPKKGPNIIKYCILASTVSLVLVAVSIIPIGKKANRWNSCFVNTINWINEKEESLEDWNSAAKNSLAVSVCNGAVYEPSLKLK